MGDITVKAFKGPRQSHLPKVLQTSLNDSKHFRVISQKHTDSNCTNTRKVYLAHNRLK